MTLITNEGSIIVDQVDVELVKLRMMIQLHKCVDLNFWRTPTGMDHGTMLLISKCEARGSVNFSYLECRSVGLRMGLTLLLSQTRWFLSLQWSLSDHPIADYCTMEAHLFMLKGPMILYTSSGQGSHFLHHLKDIEDLHCTLFDMGFQGARKRLPKLLFLINQCPACLVPLTEVAVGDLIHGRYPHPLWIWKDKHPLFSVQLLSLDSSDLFWYLSVFSL